MKHTSASAIAIAVIGLAPSCSCGSLRADEVTDALTDLAQNEIRRWLDQPVVREQVKAQNSRLAGISEADLVTLDKQWRAQVETTNRPLVDEVLGNPLSAYLAEIRDGSDGRYTEIFVMDSVGLNVGQSNITSDYWRGDEDKWLKILGSGPEAIHVGAATVGINIDAL